MKHHLSSEHPDLSYPKYRQLLEQLDRYRFATTHQLARANAASYRSHRSALRQTLRQLCLLKSHDYVTRLERRVGGWQGGSTIGIWAITTSGHRFLTGSTSRKRPHHISTTFLEHCLAVTELQITAQEITAHTPSISVTMTTEPECWRSSLGPHGDTLTLKPDLEMRVDSAEYVDRYFVEVDRATENPARVIRKCWQYQQHRRTGLEQQHTGVYPAVVWVVPHHNRKQQLVRFIIAEGLPQEMFVVITPDQFAPLIRDGPAITGSP